MLKTNLLMRRSRLQMIQDIEKWFRNRGAQSFTSETMKN